MRSNIIPNLIMLLLLAAGYFYSTPSFAQENAATSSEDADSPHWGFDPEYENFKPRVSYVPGIKVIRGKTQVIVPEHESFCPAGSVFKFNNGDIQVRNYRSSDSGKTWRQVEHILENSTYQYPGPDGEVIMFKSSHTSEHSKGSGRPEASLTKTDQKGVLEAKFFRSNDHGLSRVSDPAMIHLPEHLSTLR